MKRKMYGVIGLGHFGSELCQALMQNGHDVLAIDYDEVKIQRNHALTTQSFQLDATDEEALQRTGMLNVDHVIVALGDRIEDSLVVAVYLSERAVRFSVKAVHARHRKLLMRIGVEDILEPEKEMIQHYAARWSTMELHS